MQELLNNAWAGWQAYMEAGKYGALLLLVLFVLWFGREACKEKLLLIYTTIMTVGCVFPVSAALLMKYQTRFYDYEWIWSYVPLTLMVAYGGVIFLYEQWEKQTENSVGRRNYRQKGILLVAVVLLITLCGRMGKPLSDTISAQEYKTVQKIVAELTAESLESEATVSAEEEICLWAPQEIMNMVRSINPNIGLVYGRNMWDAKLGANFYEGYGEVEERLYLWMCNAEETGTLTCALEDETHLDVVNCVEDARAVGVNRILLPGTIEEEEIRMLSRTLQIVVKELQGYYLLEI